MLKHRNSNQPPKISVNSVANVCGCDVLGPLKEEIVLNGGRAQKSTKRAKEIAERCYGEPTGPRLPIPALG
jgi:hypothetical protein